MPAFRIVWEFQESNGASFQEVYYRDANSPSEAAALGNALKIARLNLLHPLNTWQRIRVSQVGSNRITATVAVASIGTAFFAFGATNQEPLPVGAAIILSLSGAAGGSRKLWLRGCPDTFYNRDATTGRDVVKAELQKALDDFFPQLKKAGYGILRLKPATAPGQGVLSPLAITQIDGHTTPGQSVLTLAAAPGYPFPGRVIIGRTSQKDVPGLNGHWSLLKAPNGNQITIGYTTPANTVVITNQGYVRSEEYNPVSVFDDKNCGFDHMGTRTSKNPLSRSRGARRAARLRTLA